MRRQWSQSVIVVPSEIVQNAIIHTMMLAITKREGGTRNQGAWGHMIVVHLSIRVLGLVRTKESAMIALKVRVRSSRTIPATSKLNMPTVLRWRMESLHVTLHCHARTGGDVYKCMSRRGRELVAMVLMH